MKANDDKMNDLEIKFDQFQKQCEQMQDDLLNQMRNFMQNFQNGPPGEDKEHEATTDTELSSTEDIQPLPVQEPPQNSDRRQIIEGCCVEASEEQKQKMEDTMFDLVKICHHKQFLCIHDNVDDLIESALDFKLLSINSIKSQRLDKQEQPAKQSNAENLLPIPSECEVTLEDKRECDELICENSSTIDVCDNHSEILFDSNNDDLSSDDESFKDIEYVDASVPNPAIVNIEEENVVQRKEEEVDLEDISQIQDVVLREKLFSITRLISNIESLNDDSTPDRVLNSFESDNYILDNFSLEFETFCDHSEETRSGNTTHANYSLPEYDSFCFEIEPDQERSINLVENDIPDNSSNDPLLEEADLFLSNDSIPPGIENVADDPEGDICFLEELLINDSILSHESSDSNFEDNPILRIVVEGTIRDRTVGLEPCTTYIPLRRYVRMHIQQRLVWDFHVLATGRLIDGSSCNKIGMVIKDLDLELKIDAMMRDFWSIPSWWKEVSKETSSKILPCGDESCWKTFDGHPFVMMGFLRNKDGIRPHIRLSIGGLPLVRTSRQNWREFFSPSRWKELSKETSSKILPCGDGSCWKTFKLRHHIVPYGELNGVSIALMARFKVISKSADRNFIFHEGFLLRQLRSDAVTRILTPSLECFDVVARDCEAVSRHCVQNSSRDLV
nr:hypothetical protein [Tanacetum cinerariifolium]